MAVSFYNFNELHNDEFKSKIKERINKIIDTNAFIEGEYNAAFEKDFGKLQKSKHALLLANGTDALEIALLAYGVGKGDTVVVPSISFFATAEAVYNVGAEVLFCDIDPATGLIDVESFKRVIKGKNVKAVMPVHIYGQPAPIAELEKVCDKENIKIVEDAAQAQGTFYAPNSPVGDSKNLVTFSFYPTKNLSAFGDAGGILTNDSNLAEKITSIRNHGRSPNGHALIGRNSRCDHIHAAVLHLKLEKIEQYNETRKKIAVKYHEAMSAVKGVRIVPDKFLNLSSWHLYPIGLKNSEEKYALKNHLQTKGIGSSLFYEKSLPELLPLQKCEGEKQKGIDFAANTLCLPMHPFLKDGDIKDVVSEVKSFLGR